MTNEAEVKPHRALNPHLTRGQMQSGPLDHDVLGLPLDHGTRMAHQYCICFLMCLLIILLCVFVFVYFLIMFALVFMYFPLFFLRASDICAAKRSQHYY